LQRAFISRAVAFEQGDFAALIIIAIQLTTYPTSVVVEKEEDDLSSNEITLANGNRITTVPEVGTIIQLK